MSEPTWLTADLGAVSDLSPPSRGDRMRHSPPTTHSKEDDGKVEQDAPFGHHAHVMLLLLLSESVVYFYLFIKF